MKKFLLLLGFLILTNLSVSASTTVYYQNTGAPLYVQRGAGPMISTQALRANPQLAARVYRSNYARPYYMNNRYARDRFAQVRSMRQPMANPMMMPANQMVMNVAPKQTMPNTPNSRLNKNYQPRTPKQYSRSGMIYYN